MRALLLALFLALPARAADRPAPAPTVPSPTMPPPATPPPATPLPDAPLPDAPLRNASAAAGPDRPGPDRVVSLNLCADQLLVLLAPERVAALSTLSRDPALSHVARRAAALPQVRADAEAVLRLRPGLVLAGRHGAQATVALLERRGVSVLRLDLPAGFDAIRAQTREVAAALGVPERAEALLRDMDARLAALPRVRRPPAPAPPDASDVAAPAHPAPAAPPGASDAAASTRPAPAPPRALLWGARGWTSGPGTLGDAVLRAAGFENASTGGVMGLETLLSRPPDLLVTAQAPAFPSLATDLLRHPALAALPRRTVPPASLICAGPFTVSAAEALAR